MFATIAGPYPPVPGTPDEALGGTLADQLGAGLGMVGDGIVRAIRTEADVDLAVRAWERAAARLAVLAGPASGHDDHPVPALKACLMGPLSLAGAGAGEGGGVAGGGAGGGDAEPAVEDPALDAAIARVGRALRALLGAGAPLVQVDEPWATHPSAATDAGRERAAAAWRALLDGVTGHVTLALPGGGASAVGWEAMAAAPFGSHLVDLVTGPDDWRPLARLPGERGAILGVADLRRATPDDPEVVAWAVRYAASMHGRGLARVGVAPSAGLERLPREVARGRLAALAEAARIAALPPEELVHAIDPRAIDARSAALGRYVPPGRTRTRPPGS